MSITKERCAHLRRLQTSIVHEIGDLEKSVGDEEREGVGNPLTMRTIIKNLQETLNSIDLELQKCPPED